MNNDITAEDAKLIRQILKYWDRLSNVDPDESGMDYMTDHCHNEVAAGEELADKLERIAKGEMQVLE